jgi:hypothetical protein
MPKRNFLILLFICFSCFAEEKRILFLGNSYTAGPAHYIKTIFKKEARQYKITAICPGGKTLEDHLKMKTSIDKLNSEKWDVVVLQEQSLLPALTPNLTKQFQESVAALVAAARASGTQQVMLYQTWGRRDGHQKLKDVYPDFLTMHTKLSEQYRSAAERNNVKNVPVGDAYAILHKQSKSMFRELYRGDGSHPSKTACHLIAFTFFAAITGRPLEKVRWRGELDSVTSKILRATAAEALRNEIQELKP